MSVVEAVEETTKKISEQLGFIVIIKHEIIK